MSGLSGVNMKKNIKERIEVREKNYAIATNYKIFEISSEGHFRVPVQSGWEGDKCSFSEYGYPTLEKAQEAITRKAKIEHYGLQEYFILPVYRAEEKTE